MEELKPDYPSRSWMDKIRDGIRKEGAVASWRFGWTFA
jgi:hypothetical protein